MSAESTPRPPKGTGPAGRKLWRSILARYEMDEHEMVLLRELVRVVDRLDELHALVARDGLMVDGPGGLDRIHPAAVESRQLAITEARLIAAQDARVAPGTAPASGRGPRVYSLADHRMAR
ncbi:MAG: terminase [Acidimicrobiia bacterium]|nr:terminase [Acidimicrobiia bacterium]